MSTEVITGLDVLDVRFDTSSTLAGSDAMNPIPDYSAAYLRLRTSGEADGCALVFTIGQGTDLQVAAIRALEPLVQGLAVDDVLADLGLFSRRLTGHSPFRWLGPEKGIVHMAIGAVVNAAWDLYACREGKPVWRLLAEMEPERLVRLVDFRHIDDALTPEQALAILREAEPGRGERTRRLRAEGYPAYTTSAGWRGYEDERLERLAREAVEEGFTQVKLKVGGDPEADRRRVALAREAVGPDVRLAIDANQVWGVEEAIERVRELAPYDLHWIEEPTSPDDVLGHARIRREVAPIKVATGEHAHSRVMFKQLLQAGGADVLNLDACRVAGINENVAILLMAARFGVPVCPHAGGVGLCEMVQHLAMFDYVAVTGTLEDRVLEYVDHLHEHFVDPVAVSGGRYRAPESPGLSARMKDSTLAEHEYHSEQRWSSRV